MRAVDAADLAPPLLRACLVRLGDRRFRLLLALHRLICDARSLRGLVAELGGLYARELGLAAAGLPPAGSFADFARALAATPVGEQQHWLAQLSGLAGQPWCHRFAPTQARRSRIGCRRFERQTKSAKVSVTEIA